MTSDDINIESNNFSVNRQGEMTCANADISGKIRVGGDEQNPEFTCTDGDGTVHIYPYGITCDSSLFEGGSSLEKGSVFAYDDYGNTTQMYATGFRSLPLYNNTSSSSANLRIDNAGVFYRATGSSIRWKTDITENIEERLNPEALYNLPIKQFKYKEDYLDKKDVRYGKNILGFIAEDVKEIYEPATEYDEDGNIEMWNSDVMIPAMLKLIQEQHKDIENLQKQINELKGENNG